jgi:carbon-monoxide dehydrogenase small subunit
MRKYEELARLELSINGESYVVAARPADTLLRTLRETVGLTGSKMGCENGDCGACTVLLDGMPVKSCYTLTLDAVGKEITTVEGLKDTVLQEAFVEEYGFQCGFCTPGFLMNGYALLQQRPEPSEEEIREWLESNLCRCTGYETIENAVKRAIRQHK